MIGNIFHHAEDPVKKDIDKVKVEFTELQAQLEQSLEAVLDNLKVNGCRLDKIKFKK